MKRTDELLASIARERPVGSRANEHVTQMVQAKMRQMGYDITSLPFDCMFWWRERSALRAAGQAWEVWPSPFSMPYDGRAAVSVIRSVEELITTDIGGAIVFLQEEIAHEPLMPKDFPFYYPEEHRRIIDLLEEKKPAAVVAVTGKHPMCGLEPFALFEDGAFSIPSAFVSGSQAGEIMEAVFRDGFAQLSIASGTTNEKGRQLVARKKAAAGRSAGKIVVCAHMDTKYDTPGAIDNAVGVVVLLRIMEELKSCSGDFDIEFVPFNGEEYFGVSGQLEYLSHLGSDIGSIKLVVNIDSPCHRGSKTAVSTYNFGKELSNRLRDEIAKTDFVTPGPEWYAGDHAMFAFRGIPCIAVTSSDLFESVLQTTHTDRDTMEQVDCDLVETTAEFLASFIKTLSP